MRKLITLLLLLFLLPGKSQNFPAHDSIWQVYKTERSDSLKLKAADAIVWDYVFVNPDTAIIIANKILGDFSKKDPSPGIALMHRNIAVANVIKGEYDDALFSYSTSERICKIIGDLDGEASSHNGFGIVFSRLGNHSRAITHYFKALSCFDKLNDIEGKGISYNNIGLLYEKQKKFEKALEYYTRSLEIQEELKNERGITTALANLAGIHLKKQEYNDALKLYHQTLGKAIALQDDFLVATIYNNIGGVFDAQNQNDSALYYFDLSLPIRQRIQDKQGITETYNNMALTYYRMGDIQRAVDASLESYSMAKELNSPEHLRDVCLTLSQQYAKLGDHKKALEFHIEYSQIKDSLFNTATTSKLVQEEMTYEFEKKEQEMLLDQQKKEIEYAEAGKRQRMRNIFLGSGLGLCFIFLIFVFRSLQARKRAHRIISEQKLIVEEKNKEILDSIHYAKHIQEAILPPATYMDNFLKDHFVFYLPKDIVSGDFYWTERIGNKVLAAVVDCTGHGVPGAFVSIVAHNNLYRCVKEFGLTRPSDILDKLNELVNQTLRQERAKSNVRDGMDISLVCMEPIEGDRIKIEYAGANNALFVVTRKNEEEKELIEIRPDRQPVGNFMEELTEPFTHHELILNKGDVVYLMSDGLADQFGGPKKKKFKYAQIKELLIQSSGNSLNDQKELLKESFFAWKGDLEQIDDVCVLGVRV